MSKWIWYIVALVCLCVGFKLTPILTWQYFVSAFLYTLAGAFVWEHTGTRKVRRILTSAEVERIRMQTLRRETNKDETH